VTARNIRLLPGARDLPACWESVGLFDGSRCVAAGADEVAGAERQLAPLLEVGRAFLGGSEALSAMLAIQADWEELTLEQATHTPPPCKAPYPRFYSGNQREMIGLHSPHSLSPLLQIRNYLRLRDPEPPVTGAGASSISQFMKRLAAGGEGVLPAIDPALLEHAAWLNSLLPSGMFRILWDSLSIPGEVRV